MPQKKQQQTFFTTSGLLYFYAFLKTIGTDAAASGAGGCLPRVRVSPPRGEVATKEPEGADRQKRQPGAVCEDSA